MTTRDNELLERRRTEFKKFYSELMPVLVDFTGRMGITPAHEVLNHAAQFAPYLDESLSNMDLTDPDDRSWLLPRVAYFIGEYFVQEYGGCWYVNDISGSRYFARYVVGKFGSKVKNSASMIDPFEIAIAYINTPPSRQLVAIISEVVAELS